MNIKSIRKIMEDYREVELLLQKNKYFNFMTSKNLCIFDTTTFRMFCFNLKKSKELFEHDFSKLSFEAKKLFNLIESDKDVLDKTVLANKKNFLHVKLAFSNLCNLRCSYCFVNKTPEIKTNIKKIKKILDLLYEKYHDKKINICLTYNILSEVFIEPKELDEFLDIIDELNIRTFSEKDFYVAGKEEDFYLKVLPKEILNLRSQNENFIVFMNRIIRLPNLVDLIPNFMTFMQESSLWLKSLYLDYKRQKLSCKEIAVFNLGILEHCCKGENYEIIFNQAKENDCYFSTFFITNGTLINDNCIAILKKHNIKKIAISLDGNKKINDFQRKTKERKSSFEKVIKNIKLLKTNKIDVIIFSTITEKNIDIYKTYKFLKSLDVSEINFNLLKNRDLSAKSLTKLERSTIALFNYVMKNYPCMAILKILIY